MKMQQKLKQKIKKTPLNRLHKNEQSYREFFFKKTKNKGKCECLCVFYIHLHFFVWMKEHQKSNTKKISMISS